MIIPAILIGNFLCFQGASIDLFEGDILGFDLYQVTLSIRFQHIIKHQTYQKSLLHVEKCSFVPI